MVCCLTKYGGYIASRSLADCVMLAGPYPNTLKRVAYSLVSVQECVDQSSHLPIYVSLPRLETWQPRQLTILMGMVIPYMWTEVCVTIALVQ